MPPRGFQNVDRALDIDLLEKFRFIQTGPDSGTGGKVNDLIKFDLLEQLFQCLYVGQILVNKSERFAERRDLLEILFLDRRAVK